MLCKYCILCFSLGCVAHQTLSSVGVQEPIFASAVPAVQTRQLRDVLREVVQAYAQNLDSHQAPLDSATLKSILRQKIASRH